MGPSSHERYHAIYPGIYVSVSPFPFHRKEFVEDNDWGWELGVLRFSRVVPCGFLEEKVRRSKPNRAFTPKSVSFPVSRFRKWRTLFEKDGRGVLLSSSFTTTLGRM